MLEDLGLRIAGCLSRDGSSDHSLGVAVLGAGTMGARIAAHLANAGVPSFLLDVPAPDSQGEARNRIAASGLEAASGVPAGANVAYHAEPSMS